MLLPKLNEIRQSKRTMTAFGGINKQETAQDNEFADTYNLTAEQYPTICTRKNRIYSKPIEIEGESIDGVFYNDALYAMIYKDRDLYIRKYDERTGTIGDAIRIGNDEGFFSYSDCRKGTKSLFLNGGDLYVLDLAKNDPTLDSIGDEYIVEPNWTLENDQVTYNSDDPGNYCRISCYYEDGKQITAAAVYLTYEDMNNASVTPDTLCFANDEIKDFSMAYRRTTAGFVLVDKVIVRFSTGRKTAFSKGDYILIENMTYLNTGAANPEWSDFNGYHEVIDTGMEETVKCGNVTLTDEPYFEIAVKPSIAVYATLTGFTRNGHGWFNGESPTNTSTSIPIKYVNGRTEKIEPAVFRLAVPKLDGICESQNRIWGISNDEHSIYASELGNERNWYRYEGISSDSYAVTVPTVGDFTHITNYNGYPVVFKANELIKVTGTRPASYSLVRYECNGIPVDSKQHCSCVVGGVLYYVSRDGIYAFNDSMPVCISDKLGITKWKNAFLFGYGDVLYVGTNDYLYSYNKTYGVWHKEDTTDRSVSVTTSDGIVYFLVERNGQDVLLIYDDHNLHSNTVGDTEEDFSWYAETIKLSVDSPEKKYLSRLDISLENEGDCRVMVKYDSSPDWLKVSDINSTRRKTNTVRFFPRRCDHFQLRIEGKGYCKIHAITQTIEEADEIG